MNREIRLTNVYKIALLSAEGIQGSIVDDHGYLQWSFEETPQAQALLDAFDTVQPINLRLYVDHLRLTQDELRNAKLKRGGRNAGSARV